MKPWCLRQSVLSLSLFSLTAFATQDAGLPLNELSRAQNNFANVVSSVDNADNEAPLLCLSLGLGLANYKAAFNELTKIRNVLPEGSEEASQIEIAIQKAKYYGNPDPELEYKVQAFCANSSDNDSKYSELRGKRDELKKNATELSEGLTDSIHYINTVILAE